jgi:hypothetical protein
MTLPLFPLLLEIHYRCAESSDGRWIVPDAAFAQAELELLQHGIEHGFIECNTGPGVEDPADYYHLSLTDQARKEFGLPRRPDLLQRLVRVLLPKPGTA